MSLALLSLGSNIEPARWLAAAAQVLRDRFPTVRFSPLFRYPAVGFEGPDFLNAAAALQTDLPPQALSDWLHAVEDAHGRRRDEPRFSSRTLDIDLVFYDAMIVEDPGNLRLPRPELKHAFVLEPLAMLEPDFIDPRSGQTLAALWRQHRDYANPAPRLAQVL
ncbi:MAG: 2-amino-4-hydroxy-6-hydroxymethyldihydropteridine diphosphokinase [Xanthomonadales bacterium]|nr:2-amino-4-hydroxy-6-hydroxymethyldihydropteridine diphosphokinase [Xanthomonadales bacterium]